jgi:hypothetical protein
MSINDTRSRHPISILIVALVLWLILPACTRFGPKGVPGDRFSYNEAISKSQKEQMLLNLVRLRYRDIPEFLSVSSVLTQYTYSGSVGTQGAAALGDIGQTGSNVGGSANIGYTERPTITYTPLSGSEFSRRMLTPIPAEMMFAASQGGWATDLMMLIALQRMNKVENSSFSPVPSPDDLDRLREFRRLLELSKEVGDREALEMYRDKAETPAMRYLVIEEDLDEDTQTLVDELRSMLDLDPGRNVFQMTDRLTQRAPNEITVQTRSLMGVMSFLSRGVEVPEAHREKGWVVDMGSWEGLVPFRIRSSKEKPDEVFVTVRYHDHWFYIDLTDHESKRAFGLLIYIFELQAPETSAAAPILTLPTGP